MSRHKKHKKYYGENYDDISQYNDYDNNNNNNNNFDLNNFDLNNFDLNNLTSMLNNIDINQITSLLNILNGGGNKESNKKDSNIENIEDINEKSFAKDKVYDVKVEEVNNTNNAENKTDDNSQNVAYSKEENNDKSYDSKSKIKRKNRDSKIDDKIVNILNAVKAMTYGEKSRRLEKVIQIYLEESNK